MRLTAGALVRLYPRSWRDRYADEMLALLEAGPVSRQDGFDLLRGALDAWLHPPTRSRIPAAAALIGGGLWTVAAAAVVFQPAPPDWPGYLFDTLTIGLVAAGLLLVATLGCARRVGDMGGRLLTLAVVLTIAGYIGWIAALAGTAVGLVDGPALAFAQTVAMVGSTFVGMVMVRASLDGLGPLVMLASIAMLVPWIVMWLVFGAAWTAIGIILATELADLSVDRR